jgi:RNA polymerase sigma factor (TIGR02999 family)
MAEPPDEKPGQESIRTWNTELYDELRRVAASQLARQPPGQTLQATALVHDAWIKMGGSDQRWANRAHFFSSAAQCMRQILIDQARRKAAVKNGGGQARVELNESEIIGGAPDEQLLEMNDALDRLEAHDPAKAELVKLKFFVGLSLGEAANVLGLPEATTRRNWTYAKAWLAREIQGRHHDRS